MLTDMEYIKLYHDVDEFCQGFEKWYQKQLISDKKVHRKRNGNLKLSEIMTIIISYHKAGMACFKHYYVYLKKQRQDLFNNLVHYDRFVKLINKAFPAFIYLLKSLKGEVTQYMFIDATPMAVCHNLREKRHKVFKGLAKKGKSSMGWFFGFKLHMLFNTHGDIVNLSITPANVDDRVPVPDLLDGISTRLIGDKGYISKKLFNKLFDNGVTLITKIKKNMKNCLVLMEDKLMLKKRSLVETIFSSMKCLKTLIHHRHRSPINAFTHLLAGLIHYQFRTDKPSLDPSIFLAP